MADSNDLIALKEKVHILEKENALLTERTEDSLMMGLVSEAIEQAEDISSGLNAALERISMLKRVPLATYCTVEQGKASVLQSYVSFAHADINGFSFPLPEIGRHSMFIEHHHPSISHLYMPDIDFTPNQALILPITTGSQETKHVFLFASDETGNHLQRAMPILERIVYIISIVMENRNLLRSYKELNEELDYRVALRSKALQESEEKYQTLVESSDTAIMLLSDGKFVECNAATLRMFGCASKDEFLKLNPIVVSPEFQSGGIDSATLARQYIEQAMDTGSNRFDWIHKRINGEEFFAEVHLTRILIQGQTMMQGVVIDINNRRLAEKALQKSEKKYRELIEHMQDCIYRTDAEGRFVYASPVIQSLMAYKLEELIGSKVSDYYVDPNSRQKLLNCLQASPEGKVDSFEAQIRRKDGKIIWLSANSHFIYDEDGQVQGVEGSLRDITSLKEMEVKFNQAQKMEAVGTLVGGIAHDFNNILAGMVGSFYLMKYKQQNNPELIQDIEALEKQSFRAADMIKQLLTFSRKGEIETKNFSFTLLMKEVLELAERTVPENIVLNIHTCEEPLPINGDPGLLQQVLMNLINNSRDAVNGREKPNINVNIHSFLADETFVQRHPEVALETAYARLSIEDNGCGISEEGLIHVFEPFYTTKGIGEGTGLGLAMIYGSIQSHQGFIEIDSVLNEGTTVDVFLPTIVNDEYITEKSSQSDLLEGHGEFILCVDDEEIVCEVNSELLISLGYQTLQASDGLEAMKIFEQYKDKIVLVLTDVVMPNLGGVALAKELWINHPALPIIFVTGYDENCLLELPKDAKYTRVLEKPFAVEDLSQHIHHLLEAV